MAKRRRNYTQVENLGLLATPFGQALRALAFTCNGLRSLWSRSNLHASQRKFFTVWLPNAGLYACSNCVHLQLLAGPFGQGFILSCHATTLTTTIYWYPHTEVVLPKITTNHFKLNKITCFSYMQCFIHKVT